MPCNPSPLEDPDTEDFLKKKGGFLNLLKNPITYNGIIESLKESEKRISKGLIANENNFYKGKDADKYIIRLDTLTENLFRNSRYIKIDEGYSNTYHILPNQKEIELAIVEIPKDQDYAGMFEVLEQDDAVEYIANLDIILANSGLFDVPRYGLRIPITRIDQNLPLKEQKNYGSIFLVTCSKTREKFEFLNSVSSLEELEDNAWNAIRQYS